MVVSKLLQESKDRKQRSPRVRLRVRRAIWNPPGECGEGERQKKVRKNKMVG